MTRSVFTRMRFHVAAAAIVQTLASSYAHAAVESKFFARGAEGSRPKRLKSLREVRDAWKAKQEVFHTGDAESLIPHVQAAHSIDPEILAEAWVTGEGALKLVFEQSLEESTADAAPSAEFLIPAGTEPATAAPGSIARLEREMSNRAWSGSLFDIQQSLSKEEIDAQNAKVAELMQNEPAVANRSGLVEGINRQQAEELQSTIRTSHASQIGYKGRSFGLCFGRAIIAHVEALRRGIHPESIKKIWVVGKQQGWAYHVATAVRNSEGGWWVIDGFFGLNRVEEWLPKNLRDSDDGRMAFFVTNANRFGPYSPQKYSKVDLYGGRDGDFYNGFFTDYFQQNREGAKPARWNR